MRRKSINNAASKKKKRDKSEAKVMTETDKYFEMKRNTEIGNTYYLKAKEHTEAEEQKIIKSYLNAQQLAILEQSKNDKVEDNVWKNEVIQVRMMNELLKNQLVEAKNDLNQLFSQNYNFQDRTEKNPQWLADFDKQKNKERMDNKNEMIKAEGTKEPWGIYFKSKPDQNHMFNLNDLPPEIYEPPPTPKGKLRQKINYLTIEF